MNWLKQYTTMNTKQRLRLRRKLRAIYTDRYIQAVGSFVMLVFLFMLFESL